MRGQNADISLVLLLAVFLCVACSSDKATRKTRPVVSDYTCDALQWADSVVSLLSDEELAGQMVMPALYAAADTANISRLIYYADSLHLGGVMLLRGDTASARNISTTLRTRSRVIPFVAIDAEWGLGMRLSDSPSYTPFGRLPAATGDVEMYDYGFEIGRQAPRLGINVVFAPVLDVAPSPSSAIGFRSLGGDAARVADLGTAFARGVEDGNVLSVAKHFPGLGGTSTDSHRRRPTVNTSRAALDTTDLLPFRRYIDMGLSGIMVGHVSMPALDSIARSAAVSPTVMQRLLREEMKFQGLIFTDAFNMRGLGRIMKPELAAIKAGANIVVAPPDTYRAVKDILDAIRSGALPRSVARERVARILFFKYRLRFSY